MKTKVQMDYNYVIYLYSEIKKKLIGWKMVNQGLFKSCNN